MEQKNDDEFIPPLEIHVATPMGNYNEDGGEIQIQHQSKKIPVAKSFEEIKEKNKSKFTPSSSLKPMNTQIADDDDEKSGNYFNESDELTKEFDEFDTSSSNESVNEPKKQKENTKQCAFKIKCNEMNTIYINQQLIQFIELLNNFKVYTELKSGITINICTQLII